MESSAVILKATFTQQLEKIINNHAAWPFSCVKTAVYTSPKYKKSLWSRVYTPLRKRQHTKARPFLSIKFLPNHFAESITPFADLRFTWPSRAELKDLLLLYFFAISRYTILRSGMSLIPRIIASRYCLTRIDQLRCREVCNIFMCSSSSSRV